MSNEARVFRVYPFAAFKGYSVGLLIFLLGIRLILLVGHGVSDFDGALILGFIITILMIAFLKPYRLDLYTVSRIALIVLFFLLPFIVKTVAVRVYLPWDLYLDFLETAFSVGNPYSYAVAVAIFSCGILTLIYSIISTWRFKFYVKGEHVVLEEVFPTKYAVEIPLAEILNVIVEQTGIQRLFDYGEVTVVTSRGEVYRLGLIEKPLLFREAVFKGVERVVTKRIKGEE